MNTSPKPASPRDTSPEIAPPRPEAPRPHGLVPLVASGFSMLAGPLCWRLDGLGLRLAFQVTPEKCNGIGHCHGGMIATLMDMQLALGARANHPDLANRFLPTVSLQLDYLDSAPLGSWVMGQTEILRVTRRMVFVQGMARADGKAVARASAVLKIGGNAEGTHFGIDALLPGDTPHRGPGS